jgi:hypothetical protein
MKINEAIHRAVDFESESIGDLKKQFVTSPIFQARKRFSPLAARGAISLAFYRGIEQGKQDAYDKLKRRFPDAAKYLKQFIVTSLLLLALPLLAYGQEPTVRAMKVFDKQEPTKALRQTKTPGAYVLVPIKTEHWYAGLDLALDATWAGVAIGDRLSTNYALSHCSRCYETSPVQSSNARTAISFALIGVTDWVQHRYPEKRTVIRLFKLVPIGIETFAIFHNRGLVKR